MSRVLTALLATFLLTAGLAACEDDDDVELRTPAGDVEIDTD